jgi:hypothetical protein
LVAGNRLASAYFTGLSHPISPSDIRTYPETQFARAPQPAREGFLERFSGNRQSIEPLLWTDFSRNARGTRVQ